MRYDWLPRIISFFPWRSISKQAPRERSSDWCISAQNQSIYRANNDSKPNALSRKEADHLAARLEICMTALQQACKTVESDFLDIGDRLQVIYAQAAQMTQKAQAAVEHIGLDADHSSLAMITRTARRALADLDLEQSRMAESMQGVRFMSDQLHKLHHMTGGLKRIAKALKMVAININIESCRACESRDSFSVLSQEIRTLSHAVSTVVRTLCGEIQTITQKLESIQKIIITKLDRFALFSDEARNMADRANPECRALIERCINVLQHIGENSRAISQSTGEIVVNLQIHDNVSQRVAHIIEALTDARCLILQFNDTHLADGQGLEQVAAIDANLNLQLAQLTNIIADIDQVFHKSVHAFDAIDHTVRDITAGIVQVAWDSTSVQCNDIRQAGSIESLKTALEKIRDLIDQSDETIDEFKTIARDATATVSRIGDHMEQVREVNFDIHLKSLNAMFKSIHLGDRGRTISVLVQEIKELATQSKDLVEEIGSINSAIMNRTGCLQEGLRAGLAGEKDTVTAGCGELNASIRDFSENCSVFSQHAEQVSELSRTLGAQIAETRTQLAFLEPFAGQLRDQQQSLHECCTRLAPWVTAASGAAILDQARLAEHYSMQQERNIHTTVLNGEAVQEEMHAGTIRNETPVGQNAVPSQPIGNNTEECELGENVELF